MGSTEVLSVASPVDSKRLCATYRRGGGEGKERERWKRESSEEKLRKIRWVRWRRVDRTVGRTWEGKRGGKGIEMVGEEE